MKPSEAMDCMSLYGVLWPHVDLPDVAVALWAEHLLDLEAEAVGRAMKAHAAMGGFPPNFMQVRADVLAAGQPDVYEAWRMVMDEVERVGIYGEPEIGNPAIVRAVATIGWPAICNSNPDEPWMFRTFERVYGSVADHARSELAIEPGWNPEVDALVAGIGGEDE